jgi:rsbT co-antagonist protein RsbR
VSNENKNSPGATPKAKTEPVNLSLFRLLKTEFGDNLPVSRLTKAALVQISHALEGVVLEHQLSAMVFTGFQESSHWRQEVQRYRELAGLVHSVTIFAGPPASAPATPVPDDLPLNTLQVTLAENDLLQQEWFLIVLSQEFSVVLCGLDQAVPVEREAERVFDTILTFEPKVTERTMQLLEGVLVNYRPDKLALIQEGQKLFPPVAPSPHYVSLLTAQFVEQTGYFQPVMRQLDQLAAMRATINRLSHEVGEPLTILVNLLEMAASPTDFTKEDFEAMVKAGNKLKALVDQLRKVNQFSIKKFENIEYLDTGKPLL